MPEDATVTPIQRAREGAPEPSLGADPSSDELVQHLVRALVRRVAEITGQSRVPRRPLMDTAELGVRCVLLPITPPVAELLSPREAEIARMVGLGYTNRAIATVLDISLYTVSAHMRRIFTKLDVGSRAAMVAALSNNPDLYTQ